MTLLEKKPPIHLWVEVGSGERLGIWFVELRDAIVALWIEREEKLELKTWKLGIRLRNAA